MGQAGSADHQGKTQGAPLPGACVAPGQGELSLRILREFLQSRTVAELGDHPGKPELLCQGHERNDEKDDQHRVVQLLVAGRAEGAGNHHVGDHNGGPQHDRTGVVVAENPGKNQPDPFVLGQAVDQGDDDGDRRRQQPGRGRIVARIDKLGSGELAEASYLACQQDQQQYIAACPADDKSQGEITAEVKDAGDPQQRGGAHPVRSNRGAGADAANGANGGRIIFGAGTHAAEQPHDEKKSQRGEDDQGGAPLDPLFEYLRFRHGGSYLRLR